MFKSGTYKSRAEAKEDRLKQVVGTGDGKGVPVNAQMAAEERLKFFEKLADDFAAEKNPKNNSSNESELDHSKGLLCKLALKLRRQTMPRGQMKQPKMKNRQSPIGEN